MAIKAVAGRHFSLLAFGIAQVAMDIEPLIGIFLGSSVLHGGTHTYLAALLIAIFVAAVAPPICRPILRRWNRELSYHRLGWLVESESIEISAAGWGALAGTFTHVALDSIMHADITPLAPWSSGNGLQGVLSITALHQLCILAGLAGTVGWIFASRRRRLGGM